MQTKLPKKEMSSILRSHTSRCMKLRRQNNNLFETISHIYKLLLPNKLLDNSILRLGEQSFQMFKYPIIRFFGGFGIDPIRESLTEVGFEGGVFGNAPAIGAAVFIGHIDKIAYQCVALCLQGDHTRIKTALALFIVAAKAFQRF